jgi:hypothetical protein
MDDSMCVSAHERVRAEAVRFLRLLPSPSIAHPIERNPIWPALVGFLKRLKDSSEIWIRNDRR